MEQLPIDIIDMTDDEDILQTINAELDKQVQKDMEDIVNLINPKAAAIARIEEEAINLDEEENMYLNINAQIDEQIAQDMEAIKNYINRSDSDSFKRRIDFFEKMTDSPINKQVDAATTNHVFCQYTVMGTIQWHECPKCEFKAKEKKKLQEHILSKHNSLTGVDNWIKCLRCNFRTKKDEELRRHMKLLHPPDGNYKCDECPERFMNGFLLMKHLRLKHGSGEAHPCEKCFYVAEDRDELREHVLAEHITLNVSWYKCPRCAYRTVRKINLDRHILYKHSNRF